MADNNDTKYAIAPGAIIIIVILAAGFCVCIGYAIARLFMTADEEESPRNPDQDRYMREVRVRRMVDLEALCYGPKQKRSYGHRPSRPSTKS